MEDDDGLFLSIIDRLSKGGVLSDIVLVGSWVLPMYREFFDNAAEIPVLRTTDLDFLVGTPPKIRCSFDVPSALSDLGFEPEWSLHGGYCKYVHPEMEVEFLIPEQGRGSDTAVTVHALHLQAQPLRFLALAFDRSMVVRYRGYDIRVPEPEAFVLLKLLVIPRRKDHSKVPRTRIQLGQLGRSSLRMRNEERSSRICWPVCRKGGKRQFRIQLASISRTSWNWFAKSLARADVAMFISLGRRSVSNRQQLADFPRDGSEGRPKGGPGQSPNPGPPPAGPRAGRRGEGGGGNSRGRDKVGDWRAIGTGRGGTPKEK